MASDQRPGSERQRTGVAPRAGRAVARQRTQRDWLALAGIGGLGVVVLLVLAAMVGGAPAPPPIDATSTPTQVAVLSPFSPEPTQKPTQGPSPSPKPFVPTPSPSPTPTPSPSPSPTPSPTPVPTLVPTATASPTGSPAPLPSPTAGSSLPAAGLVILEPADGATVPDRIVVVRGLAQPGSTVTRDVPMWFDEHVVADSRGRWSFAVGLNDGENVLTFRAGDDTSTERILTLNYQP